MRITIEQLQEWKACYTTARLKKLFNGKAYLTPLEILKMKGIPIEDKLWVICQPNAMTVKQATKCVNAIGKFIQTHEIFETTTLPYEIKRHKRLKNPIRIAGSLESIFASLLWYFSSIETLALVIKALQSH